MTPLVVIVLLASVDRLVQCQLSRPYRGPPVIPVLLPGGFIADTEEVARARDVHFSAHARAAGAARGSEETSLTYQPTVGGRREQFTGPAQQSTQQDYNDGAVQQQQYTGPSREVRYQAASNPPQGNTFSPLQNNKFQNQGAVSYLYSPEGSRYRGPPVIPVLLPNGYIADTADVESAKENHFRLVAQAEERARRTSPYREVQEEQRYPAAPTGRSAAATVLLPDGHLADTAEVTAAKISHLQQLLDTARRNLPGQQQYR